MCAFSQYIKRELLSQTGRSHSSPAVMLCILETDKNASLIWYIFNIPIDFNIPIESWEQAAQDRTKWRCLINKGASQFEEKRICEAERKRKERKARAKEPSSVSAQSEFTCCICNRQFRAKIGLYSHKRTHKHT